MDRFNLFFSPTFFSTSLYPHCNNCSSPLTPLSPVTALTCKEDSSTKGVCKWSLNFVQSYGYRSRFMYLNGSKPTRTGFSLHGGLATRMIKIRYWSPFRVRFMCMAKRPKQTFPSFLLHGSTI